MTLNLFESNWWNSLSEINVLKSVNKLCFAQNDKVSLSLKLVWIQIWEFDSGLLQSPPNVIADATTAKKMKRMVAKHMMLSPSTMSLQYLG